MTIDEEERIIEVEFYLGNYIGRSIPRDEIPFDSPLYIQPSQWWPSCGEDRELICANSFFLKMNHGYAPAFLIIKGYMWVTGVWKKAQSEGFGND
jgi:hypothetical protein